MAMDRPYSPYRERVDAKRARIIARREVDLWTSGRSYDPEAAWEAQMREQSKNAIRYMLQFQEFRDIYLGELRP